VLFLKNIFSEKSLRNTGTNFFYYFYFYPSELSKQYEG